MRPEQAADPAPDARPGSRAIFRALLITLLLLVQCVGATPGEPFDEERLRRPEGARAVGWIGRGLSLVGQGREEEAVRRWLIGSSKQLIELRKRALAPFEPFFYYTATHQQWGLFISPKRESYRMRVEARAGDGRWQLLYSVLQQDHADLSLVRYRRLRALYNPSIKRGPGPQYAGFVSWLSRRLFARHADYREVRVRMEQILIGRPGEPVQSTGFDYVETRARSET